MTLGTRPVKIIESRDVTLTTIVSNDCQEDVFSYADYNGRSENLVFKTHYDISKIKIYDQSGQLDFELVVKSNHFKLNKNIFGVGTHTLGFIIEDREEVFLAEVEFR